MFRVISLLLLGVLYLKSLSCKPTSGQAAEESKIREYAKETIPSQTTEELMVITDDKSVPAMKRSPRSPWRLEKINKPSRWTHKCDYEKKSKWRIRCQEKI